MSDARSMWLRKFHLWFGPGDKSMSHYLNTRRPRPKRKTQNPPIVAHREYRCGRCGGAMMEVNEGERYVPFRKRPGDTWAHVQCANCFGDVYRVEAQAVPCVKVTA